MFVALLVMLAALPPTQAKAQQARLCFAEVPDCIEGRFAEYWQQNGGLPVFGFPIGPARQEQVGGGQFLVQPFERNRFELHPENGRPYDVLLGRLGVDRLAQLGRPWEGQPKAPVGSRPGCQYFGETQHLVCDQFLSYWSSHGLSLDGRSGYTAAESLALFGLPITEAAVENGSDGKPYMTQWFERARFELHPEVGPNAVLLGLLGREVGSGGGGGGGGSTPPAADVPAAVNARISPTSGPGGTTFTGQGLSFQPGERVGVYVTRPDQSVNGAPFQVGTGADGVTDEVQFTPDVGAPQGVWAMTFEGVSSGHKAIAYFRVTESAAPPADQGGVPASVNASVTPPSGPGGTVFAMIGYGFRPGERIGVYITGPDQSVYGAPFQVGAGSDGASDVVTFSSVPDIPKGVYAVTFEGVSSGHKAIAYFRIV